MVGESRGVPNSPMESNGAPEYGLTGGRFGAGRLSCVPPGRDIFVPSDYGGQGPRCYTQVGIAYLR